jgi:hypothetical protein
MLLDTSQGFAKTDVLNWDETGHDLEYRIPVCLEIFSMARLNVFTGPVIGITDCSAGVIWVAPGGMTIPGFFKT